MKIKINFKKILVVLTVLALLVIPSYVFAAEDLNDFFNTNTGWEDITDGTGSEGTGAEKNENKENGTNTGTGTQGNETITNTGNGSNTNNNTGANTNTNTNGNVAGTNTNQNNNKKPQTYDKAGIAEDTMMIVSVIALIMIAICAYNKVNEYKGI